MIFSGIPHSTIFGSPKYARQIPYLAFLAVFGVPVASETALTTSLLDLSLKLLCGKMLAKFYLNFGPKYNQWLATKHSQSMSNCVLYSTQGITGYQCSCIMTRYCALCEHRVCPSARCTLNMSLCVHCCRMLHCQQQWRLASTSGQVWLRATLQMHKKPDRA